MKFYTKLPVTLEDQITALKGSVQKWERVVEDLEEENGITNCPCCQAFYYPPQEGMQIKEDGYICILRLEMCRYCPIAAYTSEPLCCGTPYDNDWDINGDVESAQLELDFLRKVLVWLETQTMPVYATYLGDGVELEDPEVFRHMKVGMEDVLEYRGPLI